MAKSPTTAFGRSNSVNYGKAQGSQAAIGQLNAIGGRAENLKSRLRDHCLKYEETWVVKQAMQLWTKRAGLNAAYPAPPGFVAGIDPNGIMIEARRMVRARANNRLSKINAIKTRMENTVMRNRPKRLIAAEFAQSAQPNRTLRIKL